MVLRGFVVALCLATLTPSARAAGGAWIWYDHRQSLPVTDGWPRIALRVMTDLRADSNAGGLDMLFLRVGPIVSVTPWLSLAAHLSTAADRTEAGAFSTQYRPEFDAVLVARAGAFTISDRNRFEGILGVPDPLFRYRNMLRVDYAAFAVMGPYAFNEVLLRSRGEAFHDNRASLGMRFHLGANATIDVGYMLRSRTLPGGGVWEHDHLGLVSVVVLTGG